MYQFKKSSDLVIIEKLCQYALHIQFTAILLCRSSFLNWPLSAANVGYGGFYDVDP